MPRFIALVTAIFFASLQALAAASAQTYPTRTVKFILPFGPASGADITTRLLADKLAARWGAPVVVENRPGGDGFVAINAFIAANDEHTLLYVPVGTFAVHPYTHDKVPYDADRDLIPVASVTSLVLSAAVPESLKVGTLREFIDLARAHPGKYNAAAAPGNSDFLLAGLLKTMNLDMAKVPYRDIMQSPGDLAEGRVHLLVSSLAIVQPLMEAGKVRVLAVTSHARAPSAPNVPTVAEAGYPALEMDSPGGIFAPRGMSIGTREKIAADVRAVIAADPTIASRLAATGQVVDVRGPAEFSASIKEMRDKLAAIAQTVGMKPAQ